METMLWFSVDVAASTPSTLSDENLDSLFDAGADVVVGLGPGEWHSVWGIEATTAEGACDMAKHQLTRVIPLAQIGSVVARSESELDVELSMLDNRS